MALKLSTGVRNAILGKKDTITATTIAFDQASSTITDSGNALLTSGFRPGDVITITGSTSNNMTTKITSVASAGGSAVVEGTLVDEVAGESVTIQTVGGKAMGDMFRNHVIHIYSGAAPASADDPETGTLLLKATVASGAFTAGTATNGLDFDLSGIAAGALENDSDTISGVGLVTGSAGYYRMYDNGEQTGESTTAKRVQGTVGTSSANLILTSTSIVSGATTTISSHKIQMPAS